MVFAFQVALIGCDGSGSNSSSSGSNDGGGSSYTGAGCPISATDFTWERIKTEKVNENGNIYTKNGDSIFDKTVNLPCDYTIESEYIYKESEKTGESYFEESYFDTKESTLHFEELKPAEFKIYKIKK